MNIDLSENIGNLLAIFLLLLLPLILLLVATSIGFLNAVFYILTIFWFGMGVVFYGAIYSE
ncbi:MAG TPA: hypothetical protein VKP59_01900 [Candidatus Thermoplasmatota archaeon]|nr:hypothetical protein [Candidatus Thermoplasmatota archaeon]